eukprot:6209372-Pleurochrysis_carterae.AAC.2
MRVGYRGTQLATGTCLALDQGSRVRRTARASCTSKEIAYWDLKSPERKEIGRLSFTYKAVDSLLHLCSRRSGGRESFIHSGTDRAKSIHFSGKQAARISMQTCMSVSARLHRPAVRRDRCGERLMTALYYPDAAATAAAASGGNGDTHASVSVDNS